VKTDYPQRSFSRTERVILIASRTLTATLLTAFAGAIQNWFYERFFAPDLYSAGPPLSRAMWAVVFSFPFILLGLLLLGLPAAYLLHRGRVESALSYGVAGAAMGAIFGAFWGFHASAYGYAVSAFYGCSCALFWWMLRPKA
jgi:O-antigen/teichoic acid export membrane protein